MNRVFALIIEQIVLSKTKIYIWYRTIYDFFWQITESPIICFVTNTDWNQTERSVIEWMHWTYKFDCRFIT